MRISADEAGEQRSVGDRLLLILDAVAESPARSGSASSPAGPV
ncbi:hypothetical protein ACFQV8_13075 [Pseudonocardia benzenivorans]